MSPKSRSFANLWVCMLAIAVLIGAGLPALAASQDGSRLPIGADNPRLQFNLSTSMNWCVAGSFNGWDNASHPLNDQGTGGDLFAGDGLHSRDVAIADSGRHEFKIVECGNWETAFPAQNSWFYTTAPNQTVKFTFDANDRSNDAGATLYPAQNIANLWGDDLPGSFTAVGDFQDWNNADPNTLMTSLGHGLYRLAYSIPDPGNYVGKVTATGSWDAFGGDGRSTDAWNLDFTTTVADQIVVFLLDTRTGRLAATPNGSGSGNWCLAGGFNGWDNASLPLNDDGTNGDLLGGDGVFSLDFTVPTAGREEWKIVECGNWGNAFPAANAWLNTSTAGQTVKFTFDTNDHSGDAGLALLPAQDIVNAWDDLPASFTAVGDFQGWDNGDPNTLLSHLGNGWHGLDFAIPSPGNYAGKITATGSWDAFGGDGRSIDAANLNFQVFAAGDVLRFVLDGFSGRLNIFAPPASGGASHDNDVWWDGLGHNSRDPLYRTPGGPVPTNTPVTLRLRAASNDLTEARVRVWNDRLDVQLMLNMNRMADDGVYEWWEATIPGSPDPTVYWYRFIAVDGTATAFYEDDRARTGGWGQTFASSPDNSWQLTVYDPDFRTPDWVKDAIFYQVFPDRFRDGDPGNNPPPGRFFYGELDGTILRSDPHGGVDNPWNTPVCDPRDPADCPGTYSLNFYGGDLQGVLDKLDYLEDLGVTAIYLNPIFSSPSNHKYDTTDYTLIDPDFGDLATFQALVSAANARGIRIVLDGVFNHTSSDSIYFDRYSRYDAAGNLTSPDGPGENDGSGACESPTSPYRDWYFFTDVMPGSGPCAGSDGTPNAASYQSWFGFESLPKLDAQNEQVRQLIWAGGESAIGRYWMEWADGWRLDVGGDVDPGTINDPANEYWEGFRTAVHQTNPQAYIVGEEWGLATSWTIGGEWDATMNYQFSSAILSFWRDTVFEDNDHNPASSAGVLAPLTPSQLDERLQNLVERYPPEALYAMLNLLGSHDTNRPLFMLDHDAAEGTDPTPLLDPNYDWSDAIERLKGVVLLQMTMPGPPTVYYGDEVGLVGPVYHHNGRWEDDPYNRQPYPWLDEGGTPFYTHLQTEESQDELRSYYKLLADTRNNHTALRLGSFDTLLVNDVSNVYAYGRKLADHSDAALVIVNRAATPISQTIQIDVAGYLPVGAPFEDILDADSPYIVDAAGRISIDVPARGGAVLVLTAPIAAPPPAVDDLAITAERNGEVDLAWSAVSGADSYDVYRSLLGGGGYAFIANTTGTTFTDTGLQNAVRYYYAVVSRDDTSLLTGGFSNEAVAVPHHDLTAAWFTLLWPEDIVHMISAVTPTENIYGQIWIDGATGGDGPAAGIRAQVGFGPDGSSPTTSAWSWADMRFLMAVGNNDEYVGNLLPDTLGRFDYVTRYSSDGGLTWYYADLSGPGINQNPGDLQVIPSADLEPPDAPMNLTVTSATPGSISLAWDANREEDLAGYEIYRQDLVAPGFNRIVRLGPGAVAYVDEGVTTGQAYQYYVVAFDTSFNRSGPSNTVEATAEARLVDVTFSVNVPAFTPGTLYIAGSIPGLPEWNPGATPLAEIGENNWSIMLRILDGASLEYKFTRGSWETVEKEADGNEELANRQLTVDYGSAGVQVVNHSVANWRDPLVVSHSPASGTTGVPVGTDIRVTWSQAMMPGNTFSVTGSDGQVLGVFSYDDNTFTTTFTPSIALSPGATYLVLVSGQVDAAGDLQQVPVQWDFSTLTTPQQDIQAIVDRVQEYVEAGHLRGAQAHSLIVKLEAAISHVDAGENDAAIVDLQDFTNEVRALVRGRQLSAERGQVLIDMAQSIIARLQDPAGP